MADSDASLLPAIRETLITKYGIDKKEHCFHNYNIKDDFFEYQIPLNEYEMATKYLRLFGDLVTRMHFWDPINTFTPVQIAEFVRLIEQHSAKSLVELNFVGDLFGYLLGETQQKFPYVRKLMLSNFQDAYEFDLARIYPKLESLFVDESTVESVDSLARSYKNLMDLSIYSNNRSANNTNFGKLFALNPQIRNFWSGSFPNAELLQFMSEHLVELNSLSLTCDVNGPHEDETPANFAHVGWLSIRGSRQCPSKLPLTFDQLTEIVFYDVEDMEDIELKSKLPATGALRKKWSVDDQRSYGCVTFSRVPTVFDRANY